VGDVLVGVVKFIKDYGAFIDVGRGVTGLLHRDFLSKEPIASPSQVLAVRAIGSACDACMHIAARKPASCACWELKSCDTVSQLRMHAVTLERREILQLAWSACMKNAGRGGPACYSCSACWFPTTECYGDRIGQIILQCCQL
jgi:hypothetical protein